MSKYRVTFDALIDVSLDASSPERAVEIAREKLEDRGSRDLHDVIGETKIVFVEGALMLSCVNAEAEDGGKDKDDG